MKKSTAFIKSAMNPHATAPALGRDNDKRGRDRAAGGGLCAGAADAFANAKRKPQTRDQPQPLHQ
jgi:hypothetical protein